MTPTAQSVDDSKNRDAKECSRPCPYEDMCPACEEYWHRMVDEDMWKPGEGWTNKALKEMSK
jgi:hypothetical protein